MEIAVDLCVVDMPNECVIIIKANDQYHRTTIAKNIEQIAFQLRQQVGVSSEKVLFVEYTETYTRNKKEHAEEWWQWRFNWVGRTPLDAQRYLLSSSKIQLINDSLVAKEALKNAG